MLKKTAHSLAACLLAYYFVFDSLQKLLDNSSQTFVFKHKCEQIETTLHNKNLLIFKFSYLAS
jgi:hypothetical protein